MQNFTVLINKNAYKNENTKYFIRSLEEIIKYFSGNYKNNKLFLYSIPKKISFSGLEYNINIFINGIQYKNKIFIFSDKEVDIIFFGTFFNINEFFVDYITKKEEKDFELINIFKDNEYDVIKLSNKIKDLYLKEEINFLNYIRGAFNGIVIDKINEKIFVFNDQTGSKPLFFSFLEKEEAFIFSSKLSIISNIRVEFNYKNSANLNSFYQMLSFGYLLNNDTYINEIKKFWPGQYFLLSSKKNLEENENFNKYINNNNNNNNNKTFYFLDRYYILKNSPVITGKPKDIIFEIYKKYCETIKLIFEYDNCIYNSSINNNSIYNSFYNCTNYENKGKRRNINEKFNHFIFLSGGLDSRIITGLAYKNGYKNLLAVNFAQSFSQDNESAQLIAEKLKIDFIFNSLNHGFYLTKNIDEIIKANDGLIFFTGASHMFDTILKINLDNSGLVINGILIDGFMGGYLDLSNKKDFYKHWAASKKLIDRINNIESYIQNFETKEEFNAYNRGINAITNGFRMIEYFGEFGSPANDYILSDFVFKIDSKIKYRKGIYEILKYDLVINFLSELKNILYHNNLSPVIENKFISAFFHFLNNIKRIIINKPYFSQNPFNKWLKQNPYIIQKFNEIFEFELNKNIENLSKEKELLNDIKNLYKNGNLTEKAICITLLKSISLHKIDI